MVDMPIVTQMPLTLSFFVQDIATALLTFNRMRAFRSRTGADGLYDAASGAAAGPATLEAANAEPHQLSGKTLKFKVNGVIDVEVLFAGADPYSTAAVIADITAETADVVATAGVNGRLILTTVVTGSAASIEIIESDAAPFLGFDIGAAAVGTDTDIVLVPGTHEYFYTDQNSDLSFNYKFQLRHSITGQVSDFSVPIPADQVQGIDYVNTITCYVKLMDLHGRPIQGRRMTFANVFLPNVLGEFGIFRHFTEMVTDKNGYAETRLIRGAKVDFSVEGTNFVRRFTIPTLGDSVNLLDPSLVAEDEFGIQQPNIDFAIRLS